jgi:diguanylate cyclase (GGDEF)-like protein/PAS domain S-box-containing protein
MPLTVQLLLIMMLAAMLVAFLAGEITRHLGKKAYVDEMLEHSQRMVSLISASALEAVISEDTALLLSIVKATVNEEPDIQSVRFENERGVLLTNWSRSGNDKHSETVTYTSDVSFDDDLYGKIIVDWNTDRIYQKVDEHVLWLRIWATMILLLLTIIITVAVFKVTVEPLSRIHRRLQSLSEGNLETQLKVNGSREIYALSESVNALCGAMLENRRHNQALELTRLALFDAKERAEITLHSIGDAVITTDAEGVVEYMNPVAEELTGWSMHEAKGQDFSGVVKVVQEDSGKPVGNLVMSALEQGEVTKLNTNNLLVARNGREYSIEESGAPIRAQDGEILGAVMVFRNVTSSRNLTKKIQHQAAHDALTGLVNRTEFERLLERTLDLATRQKRHCALLYCDLDQFKVVNDTCGHAAGDSLLKQLASILYGQLREEDTFGRLGGDEFGVILRDCEPSGAIRVTEKLRESTREFRFLWQQKTFAIGVSIGVVFIDDSFANTDALLQAADEACYAAKEAGRNRIHVYEPNDDTLERRRGEMQWVSRLHAALEEDRFRLYAQTIQGLGPNAEPGYHYEVLIRMVDEQGELVPPGAFVPAAERYGIMPSIDRWVVRNVIQWLSTRQRHLDDLSFCSINLSAPTLSDPDFPQFIKALIETSGVPPEKLCFEITETSAISNFNQALKLISALKEKNCLFALDDFGSGMSSFGYLKNLPVDFLKIEGSFVREIVSDNTSMALVRSINDIGHVMGKKTIAEFVEDDAVLAVVSQLGIDYAQGYGISKPVPIDEFAASRDSEEPQLGTG